MKKKLYEKGKWWDKWEATYFGDGKEISIALEGFNIPPARSYLARTATVSNMALTF
jgi:hypothetical protein